MFLKQINALRIRYLQTILKISFVENLKLQSLECHSLSFKLIIASNEILNACKSRTHDFGVQTFFPPQGRDCNFEFETFRPKIS